MTLTLTPEMEALVNEQLATGQFATQEEVVRAALLSMRFSYEELKADIAEAVGQADRGELAPFDPIATAARVKAKRAAEGEFAEPHVVTTKWN